MVTVKDLDSFFGLDLGDQGKIKDVLVITYNHYDIAIKNTVTHTDKSATVDQSKLLRLLEQVLI